MKHTISVRWLPIPDLVHIQFHDHFWSTCGFIFKVKILFLNKQSYRSLQLCSLLSLEWLTNFKHIFQSFWTMCFLGNLYVLRSTHNHALPITHKVTNPSSLVCNERVWGITCYHQQNNDDIGPYGRFVASLWHYQLHIQIQPLDQITSCLKRLAFVNYKNHHFKFRNGNWNTKLIGGQGENFLLFEWWHKIFQVFWLLNWELCTHTL